MRKRSAFTLIDTLIAIVIMSILATIVYPQMADATNLSVDTGMATLVTKIREMIAYHAAVRDVPVSKEGFPNQIAPSWFRLGRLPADGWTHSTLSIQTVHGGKGVKYPNKKSFVVRPDGLPAGQTAWYNASNGSFCVLVPRIGTNAEIEAAFNAVNGVAE